MACDSRSFEYTYQSSSLSNADSVLLALFICALYSCILIGIMQTEIIACIDSRDYSCALCGLCMSFWCKGVMIWLYLSRGGDESARLNVNCSVKTVSYSLWPKWWSS
jgi:hypothetical protein